MLEIINLQKSYDGQPLLEGVEFRLGSDETVCLLGPSGSGKSTLLRIIAGLEQPDGGRVLWNGRDLAGTPAHRRGFGLMFQDYALFPHLTVFQNAVFGLRMQRLARPEADRRARQALKQVNMLEFSSRSVGDLSGGEQQRVALARMLAPRPKLLMFDEPLGALDRSLREELLQNLRAILHGSRAPAIYVTHDQEEAFTLADRILLLHDGRILQQGSPAELHAAPNSAWAAEFLGLGNLISGRADGSGRFETRFGTLAARCSHSHAAGETVRLLLRPNRIELSAGQGGRGGQAARVADAVFLGERYRITLDNGLSCLADRDWQAGQAVQVFLQELECLGVEADRQVPPGPAG